MFSKTFLSVALLGRSAAKKDNDIITTSSNIYKTFFDTASDDIIQNQNESTKVQTPRRTACAILLIDGLDYLYAFTSGLPLVARGESDTVYLQ